MTRPGPYSVLGNGNEVGRKDPRVPGERPGDLARAEVDRVAVLGVEMASSAVPGLALR